MTKEKAPGRLIYLDQVRSALKDLRGVILPNGIVEKAVSRTLDSLASSYPEFSIVHKDAERLGSKVAKEIKQKGAVFLDYHSFRNQIPQLNSAALAVARARFYPVSATPGKGLITGKSTPLSVQREKIAKKFFGKEVMLVDDLLTTGWTFTKLIPYLTESGVKIVAIGVAISNKDDKEFPTTEGAIPVHAGYRLDPKKDVEAYELKNFLAVPGSGVPYFEGAVADSKSISDIRRSLQRYLHSTHKDASLLTREVFALELSCDGEELSRKVGQIVGSHVETEELVDVLRTIRFPHFNPDLVGSTRGLYIGDYHSPAWRMTEKVWKEFSKRQLETSIRLYEDIRSVNASSVTVGQLGIFDEVAPDSSMSVERFLAQKVKLLDHE